MSCPHVVRVLVFALATLSLILSWQASGQSHPSPDNRPPLTHFHAHRLTLVFKVCIRTLNFFLVYLVSPELASKALDGRDFVRLSFWCLEGDQVLGRLTGTSGSSRVEQRLPLMQPLPTAHQGPSLFVLALSVFSRYGLKSRLPMVPSPLELLACLLHFSHLCVTVGIFVTSAIPRM